MAGNRQRKIERGKGRPDSGYALNGIDVPGTTTITGRFKDHKGLMRWTWGQGLAEGRARQANICAIRAAGLLGIAAPKPRKVVGQYGKRDKAGELGGYVHDAVEMHLHGGDGAAHIASLDISDEDREKCVTAFGAYLAWRISVDIEVVATEVAMVSKAYEFGGTLDCVAMIDGKRALLDWKTSNGVYADYIVQLGAYAVLWHETRGEAFDEAHLLRFDKETGEFEHHHWDKATLRKGAAAFLTARKLWDQYADLEQMFRRGRR